MILSVIQQATAFASVETVKILQYLNRSMEYRVLCFCGQ